MQTLQAKATNLSRRLLRASCDGHDFRLLNLLAWTDLSQQRCGSATTAPFSYSDATTFKSSASVYIGYTPALRCIWMIYARGPRARSAYYHPYTPKRRGITNTYTVQVAYYYAWSSYIHILHWYLCQESYTTIEILLPKAFGIFKITSQLQNCIQ